MRKSQVDYNIKDRPSAAKAGLFSRVIMYELKPVPFKLKSGLALVAAFVAASLCVAQAPKRPMTFDDMMAMKRLGETAVSPDGKWLVYSVTTVNLAQNSKDTWLWEQEIGSADKASFKMAVAQLAGCSSLPMGALCCFSLRATGGSRSGWPALTRRRELRRMRRR